MTLFFVGLITGVVCPPFVYLMFFLGTLIYKPMEEEKNYFGMLLAVVFIAGPSLALLINSKGDPYFLAGVALGVAGSYILFWREVFTGSKDTQNKE